MRDLDLDAVPMSRVRLTRNTGYDRLQAPAVYQCAKERATQIATGRAAARWARACNGEGLSAAVGGDGARPGSNLGRIESGSNRGDGLVARSRALTQWWRSQWRCPQANVHRPWH